MDVMSSVALSGGISLLVVTRGLGFVQMRARQQLPCNDGSQVDQSLFCNGCGLQSKKVGGGDADGALGSE